MNARGKACGFNLSIEKFQLICKPTGGITRRRELGREQAQVILTSPAQSATWIGSTILVFQLKEDETSSTTFVTKRDPVGA